MVYKLDSMVHSLVLYEWRNDISLFQIKDIFDQFVLLVGSEPYNVGISTSPKHYTYRYSYFCKRDVINRPVEWEDLAYQWLREEGVMSSFSISCACSPNKKKRAMFHIDEIASPQAKELIFKWLDIIVDRFDPVYGYVSNMTYGDSPYYYALGYGCDPFSDPDEHQRRGDFWDVFGKKESCLDRRFRDIYPVNLISEGHLALKVGGLLLPDWINQGKRGIVKKTGTDCWKWSIDNGEAEHVRKAMLHAGHLIATV